MWSRAEAHHQLGRRGRHARRRSGSTLASLLMAALAGSLTFAVLTGGGQDAREARPLIEELDRAAEALGLGLRQVNLTGHRHTDDRDVFDALDLPNVRSLLRFDGAAIEARIRRLPWVATASIERTVPGQVDIHITEREPFAVWRRGGREHLIDKSGRVLTAIPAGSAPGLPIIAGEGAAVEAAAILGIVAGFPEIEGRIDAAERIGDRRWSLRLAGGPVIHLPAERPEAALGELMRRPGATLLLGPATAVIDLRNPGRASLRAAAPQVQAAAALPRLSLEP
jgi:cell division protein FtsQ